MPISAKVPELLRSGADAELMRYISSANIACGGHAGDVETMTATITIARSLGVAVGAHPGYPDRANFGRTEIAMPAAALEQTVHHQIAALMEIAAKAGVPVVHIKPHGALYHSTNTSMEAARAVGRAALSLDSRFVMVGQSGSASLSVWSAMGLRCVGEAFADRAYESDGTLRKRSLPGALLAGPDAASAQALDIALRQRVISYDGSALSVKAETLCLHSDTPGAAAIARVIHETLRAGGVLIRALR
jgi:UPF0271 protein